jgi:L-ascorbate metabolism protein UlaG (beta-lactamase superfamily)
MTELTITKHAHACLTLAHDGRTLLLDPGVFEPSAARLLAEADAVLITHDHFDHVDVDAVREVLASRPELALYAPAAVAAALGEEAGARVNVVGPGDGFEAAGLDVRVVGGSHAPIHADLPEMSNVGFLVGGVYHPGDSYVVPDAEVDTLLLPTSGPWAKLGEAADFVRAVAPRRSVQIHDAMLSEIGRGSMDTFLGKDGLTGVPLLSPSAGETV